MRRHRAFTAVLAVALVSWSTTVWSQTLLSGSIAGVVRDTTGAVLPGVTVEAASPALIEKARTAITDSQGQYKVLDLRPGTYTVTFTLAGFSTVRREGIVLTTGFTAPANAEMRLGAIEETVVVTGASPVVDVQNVRTQQVISHELLDSLPTGKTFQGFAALTLGATGSVGDVGGNRGETHAGWQVHGGPSNDARVLQDGMMFASMEGNGGTIGRLFMVDQGSIQETVIQTSGMSAETETGGAQFNYVPKDGGNNLSVYFSTQYANENFQSTNLTDELIARGLAQTPGSRDIYDQALGVGGPIKKDKLWFYTSHRRWGATVYALNSWFNLTQGTRFYTPDLEHPAWTGNMNRNHSVRLTWQATNRSKFTFMNSLQPQNCFCGQGVGATGDPGASNNHLWGPMNLTQMTWSYPRANSLLIEAGVTGLYTNFTPTPYSPDIYNGFGAAVTPADVPMVELSTGFNYNSWMTGFTLGHEVNPLGNKSHQGNGRASVSYVTGSHVFKTGMSLLVGKRDNQQRHPRAIKYGFLSGVPFQLTQAAMPNRAITWIRPNLGLYAQDQWTVERLTLNLGVRFDYLHGYADAVHIEAGPFVDERNWPKVENLPRWKDVTPRLGAAYDIFGNGRTAVKVSLGRYVALESSDLAILLAPSNNIVGYLTRTWNDTNGNYEPDCNLKSAAANGECGPMPNDKFGTLQPTNRWDSEALLEGWGVRGYNWQHSATLQHELRPGFGVTVGYYRTWFGNLRTNDNAAVGPADYDEYCITTPIDPRLPGGGGQQLCGLYDVTPAKFGLVDTVVTNSKKFGRRVQQFDGIDYGVNARFGNGALIQGGVATGRTLIDDCEQEVDAPARPGFCRNSPGWWTQGGQVKISGFHPLPWGFQTSAVYQNLAGPAISANYLVANAAIAPSLGRNLSACAGRVPCTAAVTIPIVEPNSMFERRINQFDWRLTKTFRVKRARVQGMFDVYNLFNASPVLGIIPTYGPRWQAPSSILSARLFKVGAQVDY